MKKGKRNSYTSSTMEMKKQKQKKIIIKKINIKNYLIAITIE